MVIGTMMRLKDWLNRDGLLKITDLKEYIKNMPEMVMGKSTFMIKE
jgi:hypothetical protein